jgi:sterol desaturase/sphingolipid hydroxylase (fatty acid hydroxylase superfamily)
MDILYYMTDMTASLLAYEPVLRLAIFLGVLGLMAAWELAAPRRRQEIPRLFRWSNNLAVVALDTLLLRLVFPLTAVAWAGYVASQGWGLFNAVALPVWLAVVASIILLDLAIYGQHVGFHHVPWLWRLHRMHHADLEFDVTTGLRFHPGEILLSMAIKFAVIALLGAPALAVLIFEVLLNATAMFSHSNAKLPLNVDRWLRRAIVTPDMHRVHHSIAREETDSNYGFNLSLWDRVFGTYRAQPIEGHDGMTIGINAFREPSELRIDRMLLQPLRQAKRES